MYVQHIVYDSSCDYQTDSRQPSVAPNATFNLAKDYLYVITEEATAGVSQEEISG